MAMFERSLFNKPIAVTKQNMASGVNFEGLPDPYVDDPVPPETGPTRFFQIPWNKLGYLKRIEIGRGCPYGASGCFTFQIWDDYEDKGANGERVREAEGHNDTRRNRADELGRDGGHPAAWYDIRGSEHFWSGRNDNVQNYVGGRKW